MLTEDFCSFEVAKLLKEKGFDELCIFKYNSEGVRMKAGVAINEWQNSELDDDECSCVSLQMAMKWLREKHNICITIYPDKGNRYEAVLYNIKDDVEIILQSFGIYGSHIFEDSYEEAVEAALKYALENLI